ncbi:MAG: hypothetical protein ACTSVK_06630 [Promethearchaeota archaeon]
MGDPLPELRAIELNFHAIITDFYEEYPVFSKKFILQFTKKIADYSKELNISLKTYSEIDYLEDPKTKIAMKALIKFAYDLLSLLISIIRNFESQPCSKEAIESQIRILDDLLDRKQNLISTSYKQAAHQELIAFHDKSLRSNLENHLQKHLGSKKPLN